jgi:Mn2+/Fe2+ NRAMP family transporter
MGTLVSPRWLTGLAWVVAGLIALLNAKLLADTLGLTPWLLGLLP